MTQMTEATEFQKQSFRGSSYLPCCSLAELPGFYKYERHIITCIFSFKTDL